MKINEKLSSKWFLLEYVILDMSIRGFFVFILESRVHFTESIYNESIWMFICYYISGVVAISSVLVLAKSTKSTDGIIEKVWFYVGFYTIANACVYIMLSNNTSLYMLKNFNGTLTLTKDSPSLLYPSDSVAIYIDPIALRAIISMIMMPYYIILLYLFSREFHKEEIQ